MDAGFHDRDDVLVEFAADIDGREQLGVAEQAGQLVGGEVHPVDLGVAVLKGYLKVFFVRLWVNSAHFCSLISRMHWRTWHEPSSCV